MAKCKYYKICGLEADENSDEGLCILHSNGPKNIGAFDAALASHRSQKEDWLRQDYRYFVFPEDAEVPIDRDLPVSLAGAEFRGHADFSLVVFGRSANFAGTRFRQGASFSGVIFEESTTFYGATCHLDPALFTDADFFGRANFSGFRILSNATADFTNTKFRERAEFSDAVFTGDAIFSRADFQKGADFFNTQFEEWVSFANAAFRGLTLFAPRHEEGMAVNNVFSAEVDFTGVIIEPLDALVIRDADLRNCRFQGTDLRKAEITGATWPKICFCSRKGTSVCLCEKTRINFCRYGIYDEINPPYDWGTSSWHHVERLYRELKQNYEDRRDYERVGDFHFGEKEMRRKNPDTPLGLRIWLTWYWLVSGYGERWLRPLMCAGLFLAVTTLCYHHWDLLRPKTNQVSIKEIGLYSLKVMTFLKPANFEPNSFLGDFINTAQTILGPILFGLFALALRQRLKR